MRDIVHGQAFYGGTLDKYPGMRQTVSLTSSDDARPSRQRFRITSKFRDPHLSVRRSPNATALTSRVATTQFAAAASFQSSLKSAGSGGESTADEIGALRILPNTQKSLELGN